VKKINNFRYNAGPAVTYQVKIQRRIWDGETEEKSSKRGLLHVDIELPFVPYVGLQIWTDVPDDSMLSEGQRSVVLSQVQWSPKLQKFFCMDRDWFKKDLYLFNGEQADISAYLEEEVANFWDKYGLMNLPNY
jgi:hypothetical protein